MALAVEQQAAPGLGEEEERLCRHLWPGLEGSGLLGVSVTVPAVRPSHGLAPAPAPAASEPAVLARCSWFTPRCVLPAQDCPGLPVPTMGGAGPWGSPREGTHFCGLQSLFLVLQNH